MDVNKKSRAVALIFSPVLLFFDAWSGLSLVSGLFILGLGFFLPFGLWRLP